MAKAVPIMAKAVLLLLFYFFSIWETQNLLVSTFIHNNLSTKLITWAFFQVAGGTAYTVKVYLTNLTELMP